MQIHWKFLKSMCTIEYVTKSIKTFSMVLSFYKTTLRCQPRNKTGVTYHTIFFKFYKEKEPFRSIAHDQDWSTRSTGDLTLIEGNKCYIWTVIDSIEYQQAHKSGKHNHQLFQWRPVLTRWFSIGKGQWQRNAEWLALIQVRNCLLYVVIGLMP